MYCKGPGKESRKCESAVRPSRREKSSKKSSGICSSRPTHPRWLRPVLAKPPSPGGGAAASCRGIGSVGGRPRHAPSRPPPLWSCRDRATHPAPPRPDCTANVRERQAQAAQAHKPPADQGGAAHPRAACDPAGTRPRPAHGRHAAVSVACGKSPAARPGVASVHPGGRSPHPTDAEAAWASVDASTARGPSAELATTGAHRTGQPPCQTLPHAPRDDPDVASRETR